MMTRLSIQLKTVLKDKMSILSFFLPVILAILLSFVKESTISNVEEMKFGVLESNIKEEVLMELKKIGIVEKMDSIGELELKIKDPSDELIGIVQVGNNIDVLISGDETTSTIEIAKQIPKMLEKREVLVEKLENVNVFQEFRALIYSLVMLLAIFVGCTFNGMNIVYEKEEGIVNVNKTLPMTYGEFILQKTGIGFISSFLVSIITMFILVHKIESLLLMTVLILLTSFITSLIGLFIGIISDTTIVAISYIKGILTLFLALPIVFYVFFRESTFRNIFYLLPSYPAFMGIMDIIESNYKYIFLNFGVLFIHSIIFLGISNYAYKKNNN